jgi:hypothetical protein
MAEDASILWHLARMQGLTISLDANERRLVYEV